MLQARGYQHDFNAAVTLAWETVRSVVGVMPTGGGKTVCFSGLMHDHVGACAAVVHRKEIVTQISMALAALDVKHRVIAPPKVLTRIRRKQLAKYGRSFVDPHAQAGVVSVQTLTSPASSRNDLLQHWLRQVSLAVFDEGHHYVDSGKWAEAVRVFGDAKLLFMTATPERADGKGLGLAPVGQGFGEVMVEGPSMQWLIDEGYLCRFTYKAPQSDLDVSNLAVTAQGDFNTKALRARVVESHLVGDVVKQYRQYVPGKRALVFATDVQTAEDMAAEFNAQGIPAAALSGETDPGERDARLDDFDDGRIKVLVNVDLFDEGFDVPGADAVILARPTESLAKYLQMVGRVLRTVYAAGFDLATRAGRRAAIAASDKPRATVIDPVRNWERHGMPNWPRQWTLASGEKGSRSTSTDAVPQRICGGCTQPYERFYTVCPYCGEPMPEPAGRSAPELVEGDLVELDVDGMAALFKAWHKAEMSDDEFRAGQFARNVPPIGRSAELKRHQEAVYRRKVLRELVAWWVGMHPEGRPMSEIHRRFFFRFDIDIGTAFTLNAKDTDALIERLKINFSKDLMRCESAR